jgi:hypothetical protein
LIKIKPDQVAAWFYKRRFGAIRMAHFPIRVDKQIIDRVESTLLLSFIGGGLMLCVVGAALYDFGRAFSVW